MRILVTGAEGRLGSRLVDLLTNSHEVAGVDIGQFDITNFSAMQDCVADFQPELVIHPAAWTDVDGCARDPQRAIAINGYGAQNAAVAAQNVGASVLYVSSNEVFDGKRGRVYTEYDQPNPGNPYAYSKWVGERAVSSVNPNHYIVRTAWLFAHGGKNFIQSILNAATSGKRLRVVTDEIANPTYNDDVAAAIVQLINTGRYGTYHLVNEGSCSRYAFARYVLDRAGYQDTPIDPIARQEWARASFPPEYTPLANIAGRLIGVTLRSWQEAVNAFWEKEGLLK
jgi:dTDP-4-dehydrorhamnose reductase